MIPQNSSLGTQFRRLHYWWLVSRCPHSSNFLFCAYWKYEPISGFHNLWPETFNQDIKLKTLVSNSCFLVTITNEGSLWISERKQQFFQDSCGWGIDDSIFNVQENDPFFSKKSRTYCWHGTKLVYDCK